MKQKDYIAHCEYVYKNLALSEIKLIVNGCGPSNNKFLAFIVPEFFKKPCRKHDVYYYLRGTERQRAIADMVFYRNCKKGFWLFRPLAKIFYKGVRSKGSSSWRMRDKPLTLRQARLMISHL